MASGVYSPNANKNKLIRWLYNSDEMGWKTIYDIVAFFNSCGIDVTYYPVDTGVATAEIALVFKRKIPEPKQTLPSTSIEKQFDNLNKKMK